MTVYQVAFVAPGAVPLGTIERMGELTWDELRELVASPPWAPASKADLEALAFGRYVGGRRRYRDIDGRIRTDFLDRNLVALDFDEVQDVEALVSEFRRKGLRALLHTTFGHPNADDGTARLRALVPLSRPVDLAEWNARIRPWMRSFESSDQDANTMDPVLCCYAPVRTPAYAWWETPGRALDVDALPASDQALSGQLPKQFQ